MAKSKIGFHTGPGGTKQGLGQWERELNKAGIAFGLKAVDEYGPLDEALRIGREHGVENWLGFRFTHASGRVSREVPDYDADPKVDAAALCQEVIDKLPPEFDKAVWLEIINEPRAQNKGEDTMFGDMNACDYLGQWCLAAAEFLKAEGYKFMGPTFNSGEPGREGFPLEDAVVQYSQPGMLAYLRYCAAHPDQAALSVHEYSWSNWKSGQTAADWYPSLWGRFEAAIAAADLNGIPRAFSIFVTEFGFAHVEAPSGKDAHSYLDDRNRMTAPWPQLKYDASWSLQAGWEPVDLQVNSWMKYDAGKEFDEGPQPAKTHPAFGETLPGAKPGEPPGAIQGKVGEIKKPAGELPGQAKDEKKKTPGAGKTKAKEPTGLIELSRQSITLSPSAGVDALRLEVSRRDGDKWTVQKRIVQALDGESRLDVVFLSGAAEPTPGTGPDPGKQPKEPAFIGVKVVTSEFGLWLRKGPSQTLDQIKLMPKGAKADVIEEGDWDFLHFDGDTGYASSSFLGDLQPAEKPIAAPTRTLQTGMNINPDATHGNPMDGDELKGLDWVRFPFKLSARPNPAERGDIAKAFAQYDRIVGQYAQKGTNSLIILNQETVGENPPWEFKVGDEVTHPYSDKVSDWQEYAGRYAAVARQIAAHYRDAGHGQHIAYQIWNEGDKKNNPASAYLKPEHMAIILDEAQKVVRAEVPGTKIIFNGMATGPGETIDYLKKVKKALNGRFPVDAVGIHPYTRWATRPPFTDWGVQFGTLSQAFSEYRAHFPDTPFWITEIGIAADNEIGPEHYPAVADYMEDVYTHVAKVHTDLIETLIWFAWSDEMRNAGVVDRQGQRKEHVFKVFESVRDRTVF